ncbi:unnamed protein product, partial [marine sediment metagenome]
QIVAQKPDRQEKNKSKKELVCFSLGIPQIDSQPQGKVRE